MSHFYDDIHEARIREAYDRIKHSIVRERLPLAAEVAVTREPVPYEKRKTLKYRKISQGEGWGETWDCAWFHVTGKVPASWRGAYVVLNLEFGGELLVFDHAGCPLVGLSAGSVFDGDYSKDLFHFLPKAKGGEKIDFWIDAGCNGLFGVPRPADPDWEQSPARKDGYLSAAVNALSVCRFDYDLWQLRIDIEVLRSLCAVFPKESGRRIRILRALDRALDLLPDERGGAPAARDYLRRAVYSIGPDPASIHVSAIGHAHIDTAWLWPLRETVRKVARTWSSQIGLIERYPSFKFGASQAQLYQFCKEHYPKLFAKVKKAVADGSWEIQGGMWVEADCNIPSGESLIRQFAEGNRFFMEEFGVRARNLWLPDVFGYSGNLPQIMKVCGIGFFLTQKLFWNRYNRFPHNTFVWEGIDGSRVVSHFPPEDTYNSVLLPDQLAKHETNNREAGIVDEAISLFGIGDGGGGPKEEFVERGLRERALNGCPRVEFAFAQNAFDRLAKLEPELDVWSGELYFEMHRGTYTTQARQKRLNRRAEEALRVAEMLCAAKAWRARPSRLAQSLGAGPSCPVDSRGAGPSCPVDSRGAGPSCPAYPAAKLHALWRDLLLCQFHDIIPGSSIARVYKECGEIVGNVVSGATSLALAAGASLLKKASNAVTFFNPSSTPFDGLVELPAGWEGAAGPDGAPVAVAPRPVSGSGAVVPRPVSGSGAVAPRPLVTHLSVPPRAFVTLQPAQGPVGGTPAFLGRLHPDPRPPCRGDSPRLCPGGGEGALSAALRARGVAAVLENALVRYEFDSSLRLVSALDKAAGRLFVSPSAPANLLALFDDHPSCYDAWDIEEYARNMPVASPEQVKFRVVETPLFSAIEAAFVIGRSRFSQTIVLAADSKRLDFRTHADWQESHRLLRVAFPLDVRASEASFEIQYGIVRRATHDNTKWQYAQFESCGHRFADFSDSDFGVALLNDSKYGYRAKGSELSLSLLRSSTHPDPFADKGEHDFTYAILPHVGALDDSDEVHKAAAELNQGLLRIDGYAASAKSKLPVSLEGDGVELAVLKMADDGNGLVVRLVERLGRHARATLRLDRVVKATPCLATETDDTGPAAEGDSLDLTFGPFEIKTIRLSCP